MAEKTPFPYEMKNVTEEEDKLIKQYYKGYTRPFIRIGPAGYCWQAGYGDHAEEIYNLDVRPDDVWVVAFSRSGTTWAQELVWLLANNLDYKTAETVPLWKRYAFIEYPTMEREVPREESAPSHLAGLRPTSEDFTTLPNLPAPRYVKTHLPLSLLPPKLLDVSKVLYVARDPRDVAVSFHFMHKLFRYFEESVQFEESWELFKKDLLLHMPVIDHVIEAWDKRDHQNMTFLFYEEMQKDLRAVIDKVCVFLGKEYTSEQKDALANYLSFENMKKGKDKPSSKPKPESEDNSENTFLRKGKSGNWVNYFKGELRKEAEEYIEKFYQRTDLRFPELE